MTARIALFLVTFQHSGAAAFDGFDDLALLQGQGCTVACHERCAKPSEDIGQFQGRLFHAASCSLGGLVSKSNGLGVL